MNRRYSLSAPRNSITADGPPQLAALLRDALQAGTPAEGRASVHGFHSYPARCHPLLVQKLLFSVRRGQRVLDPFCGSGTTLVEATLRGAHAVGVDCNPLAVALSRCKATPTTAAQRRLCGERAQIIATASSDRVKRRARTRHSGQEYDDPSRYAPHVFRELVGLRELIDDERDRGVRETLLLVLSAIVMKVSRRAADTSEQSVERNIGKGLSTRLFLRKTEELLERMAEFSERIPKGTPRPTVHLGDARALPLADASCALICTSPPYLGTYDYLHQHAPRLGWLGLSAGAFDEREIGARRQGKRAVDNWQSSVDAFVAEFARVLEPNGRAYLLIGDAVIDRKTVPGDLAVRHAAKRAGLQVVAHASSQRPQFFATAQQPTVREHLLAFDSIAVPAVKRRISERRP